MLLGISHPYPWLILEEMDVKVMMMMQSMSWHGSHFWVCITICRVHHGDSVTKQDYYYYYYYVSIVLVCHSDYSDSTMDPRISVIVKFQCIGYYIPLLSVFRVPPRFAFASNSANYAWKTKSFILTWNYSVYILRAILRDMWRDLTFVRVTDSNDNIKHDWYSIIIPVSIYLFYSRNSQSHIT